jgi:uncharacterized protein YndB with AHSA1/START domain
MKIQRSIEIASRPKKIWPFLVEPEKIIKWCVTFKKFEYTAGRHIGLDTPVYVEEKAGGPLLMKLNCIVTKWVENEKFVFKMTSGTFVKSYEQRCFLTPTPSGSTFTFMKELVLPFGIVSKLIGAFMQRRSEAHVKQMLMQLKSMAEA